MMEFGKNLRAAREAKGLSCSQVAEKTHLMIQIIEGLENENFKKIVAPIYGRGFVKLYCETVDLDPKPYIDEFMRLFSLGKTPEDRPSQSPIPEGQPHAPAAVPPPPVSLATQVEINQTPTSAPKPISVQSSIPTASTAPAALSPRPENMTDNHAETLIQPPPPKPQPSRPVGPLFEQQPASPSAALPPRPPHNDGPLFDQPTQSEPKQKRTFHLPQMDIPEVPPSLWRIAALVIAFILIIWGLTIGVRALYRATMTPPAAPTTSEQAQLTQPPPPKQTATKPAEKQTANPAASTAAKLPRAPRTPIDIPPLYID